MKRAPNLKRLILTYSLVLSMSAVGFCQRPTMAQTDQPQAGEQSQAAKANPPRRTCCCGTKDGKCCGMGCCATQAPKPAPVETPLRPSNSEQDVLQLVLQVNSMAAGNDIGGGNACCILSADSTLAVPSLQSQHVRIQT